MRPNKAQPTVLAPLRSARPAAERRLTFELKEGHAYLLDYEDYH